MNESVTEFIDTNEWVPLISLPGFECAIEYYINRKGQLMSTKGGKQKILVAAAIKSGYKKLNLQQRLGQKGEKQVYVHTLVALAFLGKPPTPFGRKKGCTVVDHIDDDKSNNNVENLQYLSVKDNICKHPYTKFQKQELTEEQEKARVERKRYKGKLRMRRFRARKKRTAEKQVKIEEHND